MTVINQRIMNEMSKNYSSWEELIKAPIEAEFFKTLKAIDTKVDYLTRIRISFKKYCKSDKGKHYYYLHTITQSLIRVQANKNNIIKLEAISKLLKECE